MIKEYTEMKTLYTEMKKNYTELHTTHRNENFYHIEPPAYAPYSPPAYAPPPAYTTQPGMGHDPHVITSPPTATPMIIVTHRQGYIGPNPSVVTCPCCKMDIMTRVESNPSVRTHLIAAVLCLFIFWPCTCLPYCINSCNNADHYCPNCHNYIGSYKF